MGCEALGDAFPLQGDLALGETDLPGHGGDVPGARLTLHPQAGRKRPVRLDGNPLPDRVGKNGHEVRKGQVDTGQGQGEGADGVL